LTVIVIVSEGPEQDKPSFVKLGVTVILATTGVPVKLDAINVGILPVPEAGKPILVFEFDQV